jgi:very-short-patch-repair endonuclease
VNLQTRRLLALLDYAQESMRARSGTQSDLAAHDRFLLLEREAKDLEGVRLACDPDTEGEIWLSVAHPPSPELPPDPGSPWLEPWLKAGTGLLAAPPLANEVDGAALIAAGTHHDADGPPEPGTESVPAAERKARIKLASFAFRADVEREYARYIENAWKPWAEREVQRRRHSKFYVRLFTLQQQLIGALTENPPELVWGMGIVTRREGGDVRTHPLLTRLVDIAIDPHTGEAQVRPRDLSPRLELAAFIPADLPAAVEAERLAAQHLASAVMPVSPFDHASCRPLLEIAQKAIMAATARQGIAFEFTDEWVLFARPRGTGVLVQDLESLRTAVKQIEGEPIPGAVSRLVSEPGTDRVPARLPVLRGFSAVYHENLESAAAQDLFFPKPFNDEQARIAQLLEVSDGVVVQGPPGTGKTHTIANIICHWLATGRRVLVTSMRDPALAILRDMLPEEIRPLAMTLLASEQEGMRQFEQSVAKIAAEVQGLDREALRAEIARLEESLDALQARLARIDIDLGRWAKLNLSRIDLDGETVHPQDAAAEIGASAGAFEWIPDPLGVAPKYAPQFAGSDIAALRKARAVLGADIEYAGCNLPAPEGFPDAVALAGAHDELQRFARLSEESRATDLPWPADASGATVAAAAALAQEVQRVKALRDELASQKLPWGEETSVRLRRGEPAGAFQALEALGTELEATAAQRAPFLKRPVLVPEHAYRDPDFQTAIENLAAGRRPFGLALFGKSDTRKLLDAVRTGGAPPAGPEDWKHVVAFVGLQRKRRELTVRWNAVAPDTGVRTVLAVDAKGQLSAEAQYPLVKSVRRLAEAQRALAARAGQVFPWWSRAADLADDPAALDELANALEYHLNRHRLGEVSALVEAVRVRLEGSSGRLADAMRIFVSRRLGKPALDESAAVTAWGELLLELERVHGLREQLATVERVTGLIAQSGAPGLAQALSRPAEGEGDTLLPQTFMRDWRLRRLATHLSMIDSQDEMRKLSGARTAIEGDLARAYRDLVVKRTWLKLADGITPGVRAALQGYLNAIRHIDAGGGARAYRYRQDARHAASEAHRAIPCWIMPHHRVSEALPAQLGCFDLVVIDEASQSDLSALPVLMRAKKVLIVGDDRQVSPVPLELDETSVRALMQRHLGEQVPLYRAQLSPERSIYDLAKVAFAENGVMLREHFRCVAPIIEYCKREFYSHELRPLRLPRGSERIDPPLLDVLVTDGKCENGVNVQEADYIVRDIRRIVDDPSMAGRSIGVVSLLGEQQALRIWERLLEEVGPEAMRRHDITCGDARTFQGRERSIMFLSMVAAPGAAALSGESQAQQFNVAASRARDQMILVRSVEPDQLGGSDRLRRSLIEHFAKPFGEQPSRVGDARDLCESDLERGIYDWLNAAGYRVMPQVRVGTYRIDLVVEGAEDTRLAVECDGDKYQGPEQWIEDMRRQRALERTGWVFWRCFAVSWIRRREAVLEDLRRALEAQGIRPTRSGGWVRRRITETRRVSASIPVAA